MVFQKILDKITPEKEELSISWEQADKVYRDRKASELENIDKREDKLSKKTEELIETLGDSLEAFDNYDDSKDLQIVEDVAQNLYRTRKRMVQNFKTSKDIEQQAQDLEDFLEEFNDVTRKEGEVVRHVKEDSRELSMALEDILSHKEDLENFIDTEYQVKIRAQMIEEYIQDIGNINQELKQAQNKLEDKDTRNIKQDIERIEDKIDELEDSEEWKQMKSYQREKQQLKENKNNKINEIKSHISEMERGLKKLKYNIENQGLKFEGDADKLRKLKNRKINNLENISSELQEAKEKIEENNLLDDRDLEKFREGYSKLKNFSKLKKEISKAQKQIKEIDEQLEELDIKEKKEELGKEKSNLEKDLKEKKDEVRGLEEKRNERELKKQKKMIELEHFMDSLMDAEIKISEINEERR